MRHHNKTMNDEIHVKIVAIKHCDHKHCDSFLWHQQGNQILFWYPRSWCSNDLTPCQHHRQRVGFRMYQSTNCSWSFQPQSPCRGPIEFMESDVLVMQSINSESLSKVGKMMEIRKVGELTFTDISPAHFTSSFTFAQKVRMTCVDDLRRANMVIVMC